MSPLEKKLRDRSNSKCEISGLTENLEVYLIPPKSTPALEHCILLQKDYIYQLEHPEATVAKQWRCLSESMWNEHLPVQIVSWRMLARLRHEGWSQDLREMIYLDEDALAWAKATGEDEENKIIHKDSHGNLLNDRDSVVLTKDLVVKGANFTAKRGTAVHNIKLVWDNENQIEGRVEGQSIVILTQYVKKTK